ncbi:Transcriptional regulator ADR1 [Candida albicans SC5314] [Rhizoctonia solani]|uniref:Transcriptional regulator ADR1 [Candida albicans SC5314] n=1 Tax=Rhizoctonia solani TaxID=456999 RepID=A0A0K6G8U3_9AGAM|nr:Transcriptional regulator ADR1 [Candida albicans SC5314] [Rhizoctonia solani]
MSVTTMQASGSKPVFTCSECSATYSRMEYLRRHERKHTETRPFQCEECLKSFARSDVLLRHRRRCHPEAEAIREANAMVDSQAEGGGLPSPVVTSGRAKLKAAGLNKRSQARTKSGNEASLSPSDATQSPETSILDKDSPNQLMHGPSPGSNSSLSLTTTTLGGFESLFPFAGTSTDPSSLTRSTPDTQSILSFDAPSPATSYNAGNSAPPWAALPPLSMFSPNAIIPKSGPEVTQFGGWYVFPQRNSPSGSGARGANGQFVDLSNNKDSEDNQLGPLQESYLLGNDSAAQQIEADLLSPERTVLNSEYQLIYAKRGLPLRTDDKFYIPPGLFAGCYTIPHWLLPPLTRLSKFAHRTLTDHLVRFPLVHQPTFKLSEAPHWLAFAMCTVGGLNPGETKMKDGMGGEYTFKDTGAPWDGVQSIVRTEKVDMLVKTFVRHSSKLALCDQVSIVQSLLLYNTPAFLSDDPSERLIGHLFLGTVVKVIRKSGMFHPTADFASRLTVPADATLDQRWRKWIRHETCRRCAWVVYVLDTIASLEAGIPSLVSPRDLSHLALPACDSLWSAGSEVEWAAYAEAGGYQNEGITLDIAMRSVFGCDNAAEEGRPDAIVALRLGPFARTVIIMTLLRGLIEFGQGKPKGGVVTHNWVINGVLAGKATEATNTWVLGAYLRALSKWREGWDIDPLCTLLTSPQTTTPSMTGSASPGSSASAMNSPGNNSQGADAQGSTPVAAFFASTADTFASLKEPVFINDALPYCWLALVLVDMLKPAEAPAQTNIGATMSTLDASTTANLGQGIDGNISLDNFGDIEFSGLPNYNDYSNASTGARIVDLDETNDKFAELDFREMLAIAKEFARGETGGMRAPRPGSL